MAFRATNVIPERAYTLVKTTASQLKLNLQENVATLAAQTVEYGYIADIYLTMKFANAQFDSLKTTPGLAAYAQAQENDQSYDVVTEFASMQAAVSAAMTWIETNIPQNVTAKEAADWERSSSLIATSFTPAQTAGLRTQLTGVITEIA